MSAQAELQTSRSLAEEAEAKRHEAQQAAERAADERVSAAVQAAKAHMAAEHDEQTAQENEARHAARSAQLRPTW